LQRARHRAAWCIGNGWLCMGSFVMFGPYPTPCRHHLIGDHRLIGIYGDVLHDDLLLPPVSMLVEPFKSVMLSQARRYSFSLATII
jgi:hypothetical protein